jgi:putative DNA primase/helicase
MRVKENKVKLSPNRLAEGFYQMAGIHEPTGHRKLVFWRGSFYLWEEGIYQLITDSDIRTYIADYIRGTRQTTTANIVNSTLVNVQVLAKLDNRIQPNSWLGKTKVDRLLAAQNGLIIFDDLNENGQPKLIDHTPDYFTLVKLPYNYDPKAQCTGWLKFLDEVMEGDADRIHLLQQWAGYLLIPNLRRQQFLICVGEGANGKGVFFEILIRMLGQDNCSSLPLSRFGERFALASTYGKLLNATSEGISQITPLEETVLKEYTGDGLMTFERKHRDHFDAKPTAKLMIATNELPSFSDKTDAVWRRMLLVPFERSFTKDQQNPNLAEELKEELPGIFNWAYYGMVDLENNGFVVSAKCREALEQYRRDVNPTKVFLQENYCIDSGAVGLPCSSVYSSYCDWCKDRGYKSLNEANFGKEIKRVFPKVQKTRPEINCKRTSVYSNLAVLEDAESTDQDVRYQYARTR